MQRYKAMTASIDSLIKFCECLIKKGNYRKISGVFQSNVLERGFRIYRLIIGSNFHIVDKAEKIAEKKKKDF